MGTKTPEGINYTRVQHGDPDPLRTAQHGDPDPLRALTRVTVSLWGDALTS